MKIVPISARLEYITPDAEKLIERIARISYKTEPAITAESYKAFVRARIDEGHEAVIEMPDAIIVGTFDRGVSHEAVRHRIASYVQESTRFCNYSQERFGREITLCPMNDGLNEMQVQRRMDLWAHIERVYMAEIDEGVKAQQARDNLPTCLKTEIALKYNMREWRHFLKMRTDKKAHPQMRKFAALCRDILIQHCPIIFADR